MPRKAYARGSAPWVHIGQALTLTLTRTLTLTLTQLGFAEFAPDEAAGVYDFDPIGIATQLPVTECFELQEAEMVNGRLAQLALVAMLYVEGYLGIPLVQFTPI